MGRGGGGIPCFPLSNETLPLYEALSTYTHFFGPIVFDLALFGCHRYMNDPVMVDLVSERSLVPDSVVHEVCPYLETLLRVLLVND